jgi:hypothetical protein
MAAIRKRAGVSEESAAIKKARLAEELADLEDQEELKADDAELETLISLVLGNRALIKRAIKFVRMAMEGKTSSDGEFPKTYIYIAKSPKQFNIQLVQQLGAWDQATIDGFCKADRRIDLKLIQVGLGVSLGQKIMHHNKDEFIKIAVARHQEIGKPLQNAEVNGDGSMNWETFGAYVLQPVYDGKGSRADHKYTAIVCNLLQSEGRTVKLPVQYNITAAWNLKSPWSLHNCEVKSPTSQKPKVQFMVKDLYEEDETWCDTAMPLLAYGKRDSKQKLKTKAKSKAVASPPVDDKTSKLKSALARLRKNLGKK